MSDPTPAPTEGSAPTRRTPLLWISGALAALILVLGTNGTLAAWTAAVLTNSTNTVATAQAVILQEDDGVSTCASSDDASNTYTCTTINKYGGTTTPLSPGDSGTPVDVTFSNIGDADAATFELDPGSCSQTPATSADVTDLCSTGDLTVAVSCSPGSTYLEGSAWGDLVYSAAAPPTATVLHTDTGGELGAGESWTCRFTVALDAGAPVKAQGIVVEQPLTWTLTQVP